MKVPRKPIHPKPTIDPNAILIAEFNYASETAFQSNEDRVNFFNYFLGTGATLIAGGIFGDLENPTHRLIFCIILLGISFFGFISFLKLIKVRLAWKSSVMAMNQIKTFYSKNSSLSNLEDAFRWKNSNIPKLAKLWSIGFLMGIVFAVVDSLTVTSSLILNPYFDIALPFAALIGFGIFLLHILVWFAVLKE